MFHALGLLASDELKEAKASDLVTGYTGQAGKQTRQLLTQSRGGVLFIDEAYQLNPSRGGHYMTEAVDELVGLLTDEEFKDKILVILAGYDADMNEMLDATNPGLRSRFSESIPFHDFDAFATVELLLLELKNKNIPIDEGVDLMRLQDLAQKLVESSDFANGRDVVTWSNRVYKVIAKKYTQKGSRRLGVRSTVQDVREALDLFLKEKKSRRSDKRPSVPATTRGGGYDAATQDAVMTPPPPAKTAVTIRKASVEYETEQEHEEDVLESGSTGEDVPPNMFEGVEKGVLKTIQDFLDEKGLSSKEGCKQFAGMGPEHPFYADMLARIQQDLSLGPEEAKAKLEEWKSLQKDLEELLEEQAVKTKTMGVRPIWRCGVCGRADKPWIACYVAPFIVRYERVPLD